jgi:hypothetical protein
VPPSFNGEDLQHASYIYSSTSSQPIFCQAAVDHWWQYTPPNTTVWIACILVGAVLTAVLYALALVPLWWFGWLVNGSSPVEDGQERCSDPNCPCIDHLEGGEADTRQITATAN